MSTINPLDSMPIREQAFEYLKDSILSGKFTPGERLTEEHLAKKLGISRTPIREALHKLESEGLIKSLPTRGFVASLESREEIEELFELRAVLEGYALRIICERITDNDIGRIEETIAMAESALEEGSLDDLFKWNTLFHDILHELIADKTRLNNQIVTLRQYILRYRKDTLKSPDSGRLMIDGHRKILLALRLRDPDLCERLMREHVHQSKSGALRFLFNENTEEGDHGKTYRGDC